jgi:hypothetical protein
MSGREGRRGNGADCKAFRDKVVPLWQKNFGLRQLFLEMKRENLDLREQIQQLQMTKRRGAEENDNLRIRYFELQKGCRDYLKLRSLLYKDKEDPPFSHPE